LRAPPRDGKGRTAWHLPRKKTLPVSSAKEKAGNGAQIGRAEIPGSLEEKKKGKKPPRRLLGNLLIFMTERNGGEKDEKFQRCFKKEVRIKGGTKWE